MKMRRLILRSERGEKKGFVSYENGAALRRVVSIETLEEHAASQKLIFLPLREVIVVEMADGGIMKTKWWTSPFFFWRQFVFNILNAFF